MALPRYNETFMPILETLNMGDVLHYTELSKLIRDKYYSDLPVELLEKKTSTGANVLFDRIGWGKSHLKMGKFVNYPERGMVQITKKGRDVIERKVELDLVYLRGDKDYIEYGKRVGIRKEKDDVIKPKGVTPQDMIDFGFKDLTQSLKAELLEKLKESDPYYFEKIILKLFQGMGYGDITVTKKSGDGGIDGIINQDALGLEKIYTQAKRYTKNKVGEKDIRNFKGAMDGNVTKGIFVTTSNFDAKAMESAKNSGNKIILINGEKLVELMIKYNLGVQIKTTYNIKEIDEDFFIES
jgi:restriction system protein